MGCSEVSCHLCVTASVVQSWKSKECKVSLESSVKLMAV